MGVGCPALNTKLKVKKMSRRYDNVYNIMCMINTVKLEMFADINVCEFVILKVFALLKFAILGLPKVNFVFPQNNALLLILFIGYIR